MDVKRKCVWIDWAHVFYTICAFGNKNECFHVNQLTDFPSQKIFNLSLKSVVNVLNVV